MRTCLFITLILITAFASSQGLSLEFRRQKYGMLTLQRPKFQTLKLLQPFMKKYERVLRMRSRQVNAKIRASVEPFVFNQLHGQSTFSSVNQITTFASLIQVDIMHSIKKLHLISIQHKLLVFAITFLASAVLLVLGSYTFQTMGQTTSLDRKQFIFHRI